MEPVLDHADSHSGNTRPADGASSVFWSSIAFLPTATRWRPIGNPLYVKPGSTKECVYTWRGSAGAAIISSFAAEGAVIALAGRRIDAESVEDPKFPFERIGPVRSAIAENLLSAGARALICSAACGADLLALDAAEELNVPARVVLPFSAERFRETSVVDRPHPDFWGGLFDRVIAKARERSDLVELESTEADDDAYSAANRVIIEEAKALAQQALPIAIIVWDGRSRGSTDATQEFANLARASGFQVKEVKTLET